MPPVSNTGERVVVAMSGGVDSSVAAAWLIEAGYDVVGVTLHLWDYPDDGSVRGRCCAPEDQHDARRVADQLAIAHYAFDRRDLFRREVVDPFVDAYLSGRRRAPVSRATARSRWANCSPWPIAWGPPRWPRGTTRAPSRGAIASNCTGEKTLPKIKAIFSTRWPKSSWRGWSSLSERHKKPKFGRMPCGAPSPGPPKARAKSSASCRPGATTPSSKSAQRVAFVLVRCSTPTGTRWAPTKGFTIYDWPAQRAWSRSRGTSVRRRDRTPDGATVRLGRAGDLLHTGAVLSGARFFDDVAFPLRATVQVRYRHEGVTATLHREPDGAARVAFDRTGSRRGQGAGGGRLRG